MAEFKRLLAQLCCDGKQEEEVLSFASAAGNDGADGLVFADGSQNDEEHDYNIGKGDRHSDLCWRTRKTPGGCEEIPLRRCEGRIFRCICGRKCGSDQRSGRPLRQ
jgi:hypothetical protein